MPVEGALYTFGERDSGKLGLGTEQLPRHRVPQLVKSIKQPVVQVACGGGHTVALAGCNTETPLKQPRSLLSVRQRPLVAEGIMAVLTCRLKRQQDLKCLRFHCKWFL